ncbi:MAG: hypothetical protein ACTSV7_00325 [Candidatus Baldrarchaeia archaeon]
MIVTLGWTLSLTVIVFLTWKIFYSTEKYQVLKWIHSPGEAPSLEGYSLFSLVIISFIFGALLPEIHSLILGYIVSQVLSLILASFCGFYYNWFIRGVCNDPLYSSVPFAWEYIYILALTDVFRMMFPIASVYCFVAAICGNLLINWMKTR